MNKFKKTRVKYFVPAVVCLNLYETFTFDYETLSFTVSTKYTYGNGLFVTETTVLGPLKKLT